MRVRIEASGESRNYPTISFTEETDCKGVINLFEIIKIIYSNKLFKVLNPGRYSPEINLIEYVEAKNILSKVCCVDNEAVPLNVLQVGGGISFIKELLKPSDKFFTLDIDEKYKSTDVLIGDICNCPEIPDESFDIVSSTSVLEHVCEPWNAIKEMVRVLKPGGYLHISAPFSWRFHPDPIDFYRYTPLALEYLVGKYATNKSLLAGFNIEYRRKSNLGGTPNSSEGPPLDRPPIDLLGGWTEQWDSIYICQKL